LGCAVKVTLGSFPLKSSSPIVSKVTGSRAYGGESSLHASSRPLKWNMLVFAVLRILNSTASVNLLRYLPKVDG
jgi:hypothetical protein